MSRAVVVAAVAAVLLALAGLALAAPGDTDPSFGNDGRVTFENSPGGADQALDLVIEPDGAIVATGLSGGQMIVARFTPAGPFANGIVFGFTAASAVAYGIARRPDGRFIVAGESGGNVAVAGITGDMKEDSSFASGADGDDLSAGPGRLELDFGAAEGARDVLVQPDGKIVVVGFATVGDLALVVRRLPAGAIDQDFASSQFIDFTGTGDEAKAVTLQPDGRIVVAGSAIGPGLESSNFAVARLAAVNGNPDGSFDDDGKLVIDLGGTDVAEDVLVQPDGKIVLAGRGGPSRDVLVVRLNPNGTPDASFGDGGRVAVNFGGSDEGQAAVLQPDGKIVVAGLSNTAHAVVRLQPGGALDTTFSGDGRATFGFPSGLTAGGAFGLGQQADGKLVTAGYAQGASRDIALARLQGGPFAGGPGGPGGPGAGPGASGRPPRCGGKPATIVGTPRRDRLRGTRRADVIASLGGNDVVSGLGGDDILCGGPGKDLLKGGPGKDRLLGQAGDDRLVGGPGIDRLLGQAGRDALVGGPGPRDICLGGAGRDRAACERGRA